MTTRISNQTAITLADAVASQAHQVEIYAGAIPANISDTPGGTKLAEIALLSPAFSSAVDANPGGQASIIGNPGSLASAAGTATYFRVVDQSLSPVIDGSCGAVGSGAEMELEDISLVQNQSVVITSYTITMPEE